jgi:hypothetical protein
VTFANWEKRGWLFAPVPHSAGMVPEKLFLARPSDVSDDMADSLTPAAWEGVPFDDGHALHRFYEACPVYYAPWHSALHYTAIMNAATIVTWEVCSFIRAHVGS